jgi:hypothetical protein
VVESQVDHHDVFGPVDHLDGLTFGDAELEFRVRHNPANIDDGP